jgi:hypothetical protein
VPWWFPGDSLAAHYWTSDCCFIITAQIKLHRGHSVYPSHVKPNLPIAGCAPAGSVSLCHQKALREAGKAKTKSGLIIPMYISSACVRLLCSHGCAERRARQQGPAELETGSDG